MIAALLTAFDKLARKPLRLAVIAGAGRNFQAGADVKWLDAVRRASPQDNLRASRMAWSNLEDDTFAGLIEGHAAKRQSEEAAEGFASFLEKRPARWNLAQSTV